MRIAPLSRLSLFALLFGCFGLCFWSSVRGTQLCEHRSRDNINFVCVCNVHCSKQCSPQSTASFLVSNIRSIFGSHIFVFICFCEFLSIAWHKEHLVTQRARVVCIQHALPQVEFTELINEWNALVNGWDVQQNNDPRIPPPLGCRDFNLWNSDHTIIPPWNFRPFWLHHAPIVYFRIRISACARQTEKSRRYGECKTWRSNRFDWRTQTITFYEVTTCATLKCENAGSIADTRHTSSPALASIHWRQKRNVWMFECKRDVRVNCEWWSRWNHRYRSNGQQRVLQSIEDGTPAKKREVICIVVHDDRCSCLGAQQKQPVAKSVASWCNCKQNKKNKQLKCEANKLKRILQ